MPTVPTYDGPQVRDQPLASVRQQSVVSEQLLGEGARQQTALGAGLLSTGKAVTSIATDMQERENADMIFRAETNLRDEYLKHEQQIRERKGQNAWGATTETDKWFEDQKKKHSETLENDVQRQLFAQTFSKVRQGALGTVSRYESAERLRSLEESAQASITSTINQAAAIASDGGDPSGLKVDISKRVQVMSQMNGWSPEKKTVVEAEYITNMHKQVIQALVDDKPTQAREYYKLNKQEINGADRDTIEKVIKEGTLRETTQKAVDTVASKGGTLEEQLKFVRGKYSGEEEDEIVRRVKERHNEKQAALKQQYAVAEDQAWQVVTGGGDRSHIPATVWGQMSGEGRKQVIDYLDAKASSSRDRDKPEVMADLEQRILAGDITDRAQLARYEPFLTRATLNTFGKKIEKRSVVSPTDLKAVYEIRTGETVGKIIKDGSETERKDWIAFQDYVLRNVKDSHRPEDLPALADRWFMEGYGSNDATFTNDPDTFGEAVTKGRKDFVIRTPQENREFYESTLDVLSRNGQKIPAERSVARDEFYTKFGLDAARWAEVHEVQNSPELTAAYALLKKKGKPVTPRNVDYVLKRMK